MRTLNPFLIRGIVAATTLAIALPGCLLLSPDEDRSIEIRFRVEDEASLAKAGEFVDPATLLAAGDGLSAFAVLIGSDPDDGSVRSEERIRLAIGAFENGGRDLIGQFNFELGPPDTEYSVRAELFYTLAGDLGAEFTGSTWVGSLTLEPGGFEVDVDELTLRRIGASDLYDVDLRISSDAADEPVNVSFQFDYSAVAGSFNGSYTRRDVNLTGNSGVEERIDVVFGAQFAPVVIYSATLELPPLRGEPEIDEITLSAVPGLVDAAAGIEAAVSIEHYVGDSIAPEQTAGAKVSLRKQLFVVE